MRDHDIEAQPPRLQVFEGVVPRQLLAEMNATVDACRQAWRPADGRRATDTAAQFAELLRRHDPFRLAERQACARSRQGSRQAGWAIERAQPLYVLRCINGGLRGQSHLRHYDSHILTLLIPLQQAAPSRENGDLILYRHPREAVAAWKNVITKVRLILMRSLPFVVRRALTFHHLAHGRCERVACVPGNVYVFNGFITLHANLHVEAGERRSLIFHYYDPGLTAGLNHVPRAWRALRDRLLDAIQPVRSRD